ncbi:hypothetical protein PVL29_015685 [Vitis rotundifolia]|uniref:Uncharacterized protein n=1 Tax=Vitis rotundifolia TaxID=103349 RepID=A0AA38ZE61_VITRO|nr:hypothetical protein PVL29_015685 [Vitis rotundifolia]
MDELEEAEEEHLPPHDIPLLSYFHQIREVLETKSITPSTPIRMKHCLYDLSIALTDCILFLEKRKMKSNKKSSEGEGKGEGQGHYSLPDLWFLCKTKRKLIRTKKQLDATSHPVPEQSSLPAITHDALTSSTFSSLSFEGPPRDILFHEFSRYGWKAQAKRQQICFWVQLNLIKNDLVRKLEFHFFFDDTNFSYDSRIWINLKAILKGEIDFGKILKAMLKQCDEGQRDLVDGRVEVEELLDALHKALWDKSYLLVSDGIWDINLDWDFRLEERLEWRNKSNQDRRRRRRIIMITTRLDGVAKRMVEPNNLYRMQPFSNEGIWDLIEVNYFEMERLYLPREHPIVVKMKDEMTYHSYGLPSAARAFFTIMVNHTYGGGGNFKHIDELLKEDKLVFYVMINPKEDANQGNDLLVCNRSMWGTKLVCDISEVVPQFPLDDLCETFNIKERNDSNLLNMLRILVIDGDATTNRVLQAVCDMKHHPTPPIVVMPLGTQVNISISLRWGNQISNIDSKPAFHLTKLYNAEEISIDNWNFVMRTSIPNCLRYQILFIHEWNYEYENHSDNFWVVLKLSKTAPTFSHFLGWVGCISFLEDSISHIYEKDYEHKPLTPKNHNQKIVAFVFSHFFLLSISISSKTTCSYSGCTLHLFFFSLSGSYPFPFFFFSIILYYY